MEGEGDWVRHILPGSTRPIICTHREALWGSWLSLEVPLWVTARQEISEELRCMASEGGTPNQTAVTTSLRRSLHAACCCSLFIVGVSPHFLRSWRNVSLYRPALSKSPFFVCKRGIQVSQSCCCCCGCTWCRITTKLIRNQEQRIWDGDLIGSLGSTESTNKETALVSNLMAILLPLWGNNLNCPLKQNAKNSPHISIIQLAPFWLRNTVRKMYTFACLRVTVCQCVAQHLTEALIATTNPASKFTCVASRTARGSTSAPLQPFKRHTLSNIFVPSIYSKHVPSSASSDHVQGTTIWQHICDHIASEYIWKQTVTYFQTLKREFMSKKNPKKQKKNCPAPVTEWNGDYCLWHHAA